MGCHGTGTGVPVRAARGMQDVLLCFGVHRQGSEQAGSPTQAAAAAAPLGEHVAVGKDKYRLSCCFCSASP